jgi:hypothetical protein
MTTWVLLFVLNIAPGQVELYKLETFYTQVAEKACDTRRIEEKADYLNHEKSDHYRGYPEDRRYPAAFICLKVN